MIIPLSFLQVLPAAGIAEPNGSKQPAWALIIQEVQSRYNLFKSREDFLNS